MHSNRDRNEVAGAADVVATAIDILSRPVQGTHRAINDVVFGVLGRSAAPVRILNEGIADLVYEAVRGGGVAAAEAVTAVSRLLPEDRVSHAVTSTAAGSVVVGAVNGLLGDRLAAEGNDLTVELGPHHERRIVGNDTAMLTTAYPKATGHVAVLVHGLGRPSRPGTTATTGGAVTARRWPRTASARSVCGTTRAPGSRTTGRHWPASSTS